MKLYKLSAKDKKDKWVGAQAEAATVRKQWVASGLKRDEITTEEMDVPTTKPELLKWLNEGNA